MAEGRSGRYARDASKLVGIADGNQSIGYNPSVPERI
jgi:hypothetical protein